MCRQSEHPRECGIRYIRGDDDFRQIHQDLLALLHSPSRDLRRKSSESLAEGLKAHSRVITYIYNMILADHRLSLEIRKYRHPMEPRNLANEIELESVLHLIENVKAAYPVVRRFYPTAVVGALTRSRAAAH